MNGKVKLFALLGLLGMAMTGCQKETLVTNEMPAEAAATRTITYSVDGKPQSVVLHGDAEYDALLDQMFSALHKGCKIRIQEGDGTSHHAYAKEVVTYTTTNESEAKKWVKKMVADGYTVDIIFDENTGVYTCIATKD